MVVYMMQEKNKIPLDSVEKKSNFSNFLPFLYCMTPKYTVYSQILIGIYE